MPTWCCHVATAEFFSGKVKIFPVKAIYRQTIKKRGKNVGIQLIFYQFGFKIQKLVFSVPLN